MSLAEQMNNSPGKPGTALFLLPKSPIYIYTISVYIIYIYIIYMCKRNWFRGADAGHGQQPGVRMRNGRQLGQRLRAVAEVHGARHEGPTSAARLGYEMIAARQLLTP